MAEAAQASTEQKEEKKSPTSIGKVQAVRLNGSEQQQQQNAVQEPNKLQQNGEQQNDNGKPPEAELTEDQLKAWFQKNNIKFEGDVNAIKEKLEYVPPVQTKEPTQEEIQAKEIAKEKKILDLWIASGGKPEDFYSLKKVAAADVAELSISELRRELKEEGFSKEEQDEIIKQRYYQDELESIEQLEDESTEDFDKRKAALEKKVKYGAKKLANRSTYIKNEADKVLKGLAKEIELQDKEAEDEVLLTRKVDEHFKSLPKETVIELGEITEGLKVDPITYPHSETAVQKAMAILRNPQERKQFLFTEDGSYNLPNLARLLINDFEQKEIYTRIYADATTRNTNEFKKMFPYNSAQALGVGGVTQRNEGGKGKIASYGKSERVAPAQT